VKQPDSLPLAAIRQLIEKLETSETALPPEAKCLLRNLRSLREHRTDLEKLYHEVKKLDA
jgi:hypothetical protein